MTSQGRAPVVVERTQGMGVDSEFEVFIQDFDMHLTRLKEAMTKTRSTQELAKALANRGAFSSFLGTISGRADRDIADMIKELGLSLETTQLMLQLVMKAQQAKNHFLRAFHGALVSKIAALQLDTTVLDSNQRDAAIALVGEIRDHIASQIRQQELVESHQERLHRFELVLNENDRLDRDQDERIGHLAALAESKSVLDAEQDVKLQALESGALRFLEADLAQQDLIEALQAANASKEEVDLVQTHRIDLLTSEISRLTLEAESRDRNLAAGEARLAVAELRITSLEKSLSDARKPLALILRQAPAVLALVEAILALSRLPLG